MNDDEYLNFCRSRGVTERGLAIVREVITNPPARRVNSRSMSPNLSSRFPSNKMGMVIQAESRSLELSSIYLKEFDSGVLGFWDQPAYKPNLIYKSKGRTVRVSPTLDFFVVSEDFIGFEECKPLEQLVKLVDKTPERYCFNEMAGEYEIPPLAKYLEGTGLKYRIVSEQHIDSNRVRNLALLYDYLSETVTSEDKKCWAVVLQLLELKGGLSIAQIEQSVEGLSRNSILAAIAQEVFYVDLSIQCLDEIERVMVYASAEAAESDKVVMDKVDVNPVYLGGSAKDMEDALSRFKFLERLREGECIEEVAIDAGVSVRTLQRWTKLFKEDGLAALQPKHGVKGNKGSKLPMAVETCISEVIKSYYLDKQARTRFHVYQILCDRCEDMGYLPPSRQAFYRRLDALSDRRVLKEREGAKRAYQVTGYEGLEDENDEHAFRSANRFLERCHIDHTQADIQLVSVEGASLGKPWLTLVTDEFTGFILAAYLSFRNPGVPSLMSAIRLMVKQHGVFPEAMVVDGGKEFESTYFETLMARHSCTIISRKGKPRAGGPVERMFKTTNSVFFDNLSGNNKLAKNVRQMSASHNPQNLAVWEAVDFYHALLNFIGEWNSQSSKSLGLSPVALRAKSIERFGLSEKRQVSFDQKLLRDVLPAPKRPTVHLKRGNEIQVNRVRYWHGCLRAAPKSGVTVDVRYDPFDLNYVYVYYQNEWLKFKATRPQHRQLDDLDGAIVAEVARHSLVVNELAKKQGRQEMAVTVEALNAAVVQSGGSVTPSKTLPRHKEEEAESITEEVDAPDMDDIWSMDLPSSEEVD